MHCERRYSQACSACNFGVSNLKRGWHLDLLSLTPSFTETFVNLSHSFVNKERARLRRALLKAFGGRREEIK